MRKASIALALALLFAGSAAFAGSFSVTPNGGHPNAKSADLTATILKGGKFTGPITEDSPIVGRAIRIAYDLVSEQPDGWVKEYSAPFRDVNGDVFAYAGVINENTECEVSVEIDVKYHMVNPMRSTCP